MSIMSEFKKKWNIPTEVINYIDEIEKHNEKMFELLLEYLKSDYENETDYTTIKNEETLSEIKQKPIEDILKDYE